LNLCPLVRIFRAKNFFPRSSFLTMARKVKPADPVSVRSARGILRCVNASHTTADLEFMRLALQEAEAAAGAEEVPVGAVLVKEGQVIARGNNRTIRDCDPTAHAEIIALREAARAAANYRLMGATLYVTIEPCAMCAGAIIQARVDRVVYGADDPKGGAVRSCFAVLSHERLNHRVHVTAGVLAEESAAVLQKFFAARRKAAP
jgi:tRNA(adenine34) deaminase